MDNNQIPQQDSTVPAAPVVPEATIVTPKTSTGLTIFTILLLIIVFPIGLIVMWAATHWKNGVKWAITVIGLLPLLLLLIGLITLPVLVTVNPAGQLRKAHLAAARNDITQIVDAAKRYYSTKGTYPAQLSDLVVEGEIKDTSLTSTDKGYSYTYTQTNSGADCEVIVTVKDKNYTVTCEGPSSQFAVFSPTSP